MILLTVLRHPNKIGTIFTQQVRNANEEWPLLLFSLCYFDIVCLPNDASISSKKQLLRYLVEEGAVLYMFEFVTQIVVLVYRFRIIGRARNYKQKKTKRGPTTF